MGFGRILENTSTKKITVFGQWLEDECSSGTSWHTWNRLKPVRYDPNGGSKAIGETERVDAASLKNS